MLFAAALFAAQRLLITAIDRCAPLERTICALK